MHLSHTIRRNTSPGTRQHQNGIFACSNIPSSENTPAYVFHLYKSYYTSGIIFQLLILSNMHSKHIFKKRGIMRIGAAPERPFTVSNIPRSRNAPAYTLCLYKSYYASGILLWLASDCLKHAFSIYQRYYGNKNKTNENNNTIHRGTS